VTSGLPPYTLRRSARARRLRVTIDPRLGVVVTVPPASCRGWAHPERDVEAFLGEREVWLRRHLREHAQQRAEIAARGGLRDGARIRFRGEFHVLRIEPAEHPRPATRTTVSREAGLDVDELVVRVAAAERRPVREILEGWFRERARSAIGVEIARHAPALRVEAPHVTVRDQRTRWGSASRQRRLSFSWRLILAPREALETVVVHELAHLRVFGHGAAFWTLVASRRPDHLVWRRWLRSHALELHAALDDESGEEGARESA